MGILQTYEVESSLMKNCPKKDSERVMEAKADLESFNALRTNIGPSNSEQWTVLLK